MEQPLPPYGCCDLGPINLTKFVRNPFSFHAGFDYDALKIVVHEGVKMLDNVLDKTNWPLKQQYAEAMSKRRIGLGITGLANMLTMTRYEYSSDVGRSFINDIMDFIKNEAYLASSKLAAERGSFPLFDFEQYSKGEVFQSLDEDVKHSIKENGLRNSHLLSVAPTGTVSLAFGDNCSSGIEPPFAPFYTRKKRTADGGSRTYAVIDYAVREYLNMNKPSLLEKIEKGEASQKEVKDALPDTFQFSDDISPMDHLRMMEVAQNHVDSAISKTINVPEDTSFETYMGIYEEAYKMGLKGVTTYRPNNILGSVLSIEPSKEESPEEESGKESEPVTKDTLASRPLGALPSTSSRVQFWTREGKADLYITVSFLENGDVCDVFILGKLPGFSPEQLSGFARVWSLIARSSPQTYQKALEDAKQLEGMSQVQYGVTEAGKPLWHSSSLGALAHAVEELSSLKMTSREEQSLPEEPLKTATLREESFSGGSKCPECGAMAMVKHDGCTQCRACGYVGSCG